MIPIASALSFAGRHWRVISAGLIVSALGLMLLLAKADARHWHKRYDAEAAAHKLTVAGYRKAAAEAEAADARNVTRVQTEQKEISDAVSTDYQRRLADVRARYDRLLSKAAANSGGGGGAAVFSVPEPAGRPDAATPEAGLPAADALMASEQALQLRALQVWVEQQANVRPSDEEPVSR